MPDDDRPRVGLRAPLRSGLGAVVQPERAVLRAGLDQRRSRLWVRPGGTAVGGWRRRAADRLSLGGDRLGKGPHYLAERAADRVGWVAGIVMAIEHSHDQAKSLGSGEHQRSQPQAAADVITPVGTAHRLDRYVDLAEYADIAPGGPVGDTELVGDPVRG